MAALTPRQSQVHFQCRPDSQHPREPPQPQTPKRGRKRLFNATIHALRMRVERTFAWEDKFKRLLLRFERIQQRHYGMKLTGVHDDQPASVLRCLKLATS